MSDRIIGIDLGTTNSAMAYVEEDGEPTMIPNSDGKTITPSVVSYMKDGSRLVGQPAKNREIERPDLTVSSVKRIIGEDRELKIGGETYTPQQVSATILQKLKEDAESFLGEEINRAVITVPAYFNDKQRNATKNAGEIAGFEVERIINEPTAAAMAHGIFTQDPDGKKILVYDLGGGTFDVSILEISQGIYEIIATDGDNDLGGDDWTNRIVEHVARRVKKDKGIDLMKDPESKERLINAAEQAKKKLSDSESADIEIPFIAQTEEGQIDIEYEMTREEFELLTEDLLQDTVDPLENALQQSGLSAQDIDEILLVGGSTKMPQVKKLVDRKFDMEPLSTVSPDESVALGAAVQGGIISDKMYEGSDISEIILLDVTPLSLGVETQGGLFEPVIKKNTTIPTQVKETFSTARDNQNTVNIKVYQGERDIAKHNILLDEFKLRGIPPMPAGRPEIEVTFEIDENGILEVSAVEKSTGRMREVEIEGGVGMSDEKISEMRKEAEIYEEQDERMKEIIEIKNRVRAELRDAKILQETQDLRADTKDKLEEMVDKAEEAVEKDDIRKEEIEQIADELELAVQQARTR